MPTFVMPVLYNTSSREMMSFGHVFLHWRHRCLCNDERRVT